MMAAEVVGDVLTIDEMKLQYPNQWVVVAEPVVDEALEVLAGTVVSHGPDKDAVYGAVIGKGYRDLAFRYLGEPPRDLVLVL
jgi:hypothetical protein